MTISLPTEPQMRAKEMKHQKEKLRPCAFPGCTEMFFAKGKQKYCDEHRKPEHRSQLYGKAPGETPVFDNDGKYIHADDLNLVIKHTYVEAQKLMVCCACCGTPYEIAVIPRQYVYPKYCFEHRNEFKRNLYLKTRGACEEESEIAPVPIGESAR